MEPRSLEDLCRWQQRRFPLGQEKGTVCRAVHGEVQQLDGGEAEAQLEGGTVTKHLRRNDQSAETRGRAV